MLFPQAAAVSTGFWRLPADVSLHGRALDAHLLLNLWIAAALLAVVHVVMLVALLRRRAHTAPRRQALFEFLPLTVLACLFLFLAVRAEALWRASRYTGADPTAMQVEVVGQQFAWYFRYPGPDATFGIVDPARIDAASGNPLGLDRSDGRDDFVSSQLVLPAGREIDLRLRSLDVIHGFSVPEMRIKQNAVPGQTVHIHFTPTTPGDYAILCTQVCGLGHYRMAATLRVVTPEQFTQWLASHRSKP